VQSRDYLDCRRTTAIENIYTHKLKTTKDAIETCQMYVGKKFRTLRNFLDLNRQGKFSTLIRIHIVVGRGTGNNSEPGIFSSFILPCIVIYYLLKGPLGIIRLLSGLKMAKTSASLSKRYTLHSSSHCLSLSAAEK
jgi:hypothetical protein